MTRFMPSLALLATFLVHAFIADHAHAQARVFVAAQGSDGNPCSFALPCRTFQHAHDVVPANGEIDVLDPAGYGAVTINKSISIQGHGFSGISTGNGIIAVTISAGANDTINLSGLVIDGGGIGANGISFTGGSYLTIEDCLIRNLTGQGVSFTPALSNAVATLHMSNTVVANNGGHGVLVLPTGSGTAFAMFNRVQTIGNGIANPSDGIIVDSASLSSGSVAAVVNDSVSNGNGNDGFGLVASALTFAHMDVFRSVAAFNGSFGIEADNGNATLSIAQTFVTQNTAGSGGTGHTLSYGDNYIDWNNILNQAPTSIARK